MAHVAEFSLTYNTTARANRVERAIRPELGDIDGDRTTASLVRDEAAIQIRLESTDLVALRAGLNTWLTLVDVAERTVG